MAHTSVNLTEAARSEHLFKINGFTATKQKPRSYSASHKCAVGGHDWQIEFHANRSGPPKNNPSDGASWVMFRLRLMSKAAAAGGVAASFACRLVDPNRPGPGGDSPDQIASAAFHLHDFQDVYLVRRSELEKGSQRRYLKDDSILVQCAITVLLGEPKNAAGAGAAGPPPSVPSSDLHRQCGELLRSQKGADVTFHVSGEPVPAHRSVLAARSPVFMALFFGDTKEASSPCVVIKDMEPEVFRAMLRFIYTDTAPELERSGWQATAMAQHLLEAADRYGLDRLKRMCEEKVAADIGMATVATTLALAEQHGYAKLKASCMEFILVAPENLLALAATEGYKHLEASCPSVLTELLLHLVRRVTKNKQ